MTKLQPINDFGVKPIPSDAHRVFHGKTVSVWQWEQECYDGSRDIFERMSRKDYAYVIGVEPDGRVLLVEDEQPDRGVVLTPAGGGVDEGEEPNQAAAREFKEETGYEAGSLIHWHSYRPSAKMDMLTHAFVGRDVRQVTQPKLEAGERISPVRFSFDEFLQLGQNIKLRDWMLRIKLLEAQIDATKKQALKKLLYG
ncbi:MAG: NUDIX hydrolase [Candidatus Andersenbacteria bacterium]|nr:NUDIX hydrolase [bacterium]MDZ4225537.1 NUDIX hydrolase [Candidatus Andersenbacteria bacterium]